MYLGEWEMKILITGGAGFVGSNLSSYFVRKGEEVTAYYNLSRKTSRFNAEWLKESYGRKIKLVLGDVRNFSSLRQYVKDADAIIHTAAQVAVTTSILNPRRDFETNTLGTFNVLEAARLSGKNPPVIFFSTNKVYGNNVNNVPLIEKETRYEFADERYRFGIPEDFPTDADEHTPYGVSKYAADLYVRDFSSTYGLPTITFRCSCMYGTRQFGNEDQGWVAHFVISSILEKPLKIFGDGKQVRDVLYIDDVSKLVESAIEKSKMLSGNVFNIGGGPENTLSLLELVSILEKNLNKKIHVSFFDWRNADQKVYISDTRKAEELLGWKPKVKPKDGVKLLINWVNKNRKFFI
jgi:CDP-paratose 2-epimerase